MFKKILIPFVVLFVFVVSSFSQDIEGWEGIMFDNISGITYMHTARWINEHLGDVSNQFTTLEGYIEDLGFGLTNLDLTVSNHCSFATNEFTNMWISIYGISNRIDDIQTNWDGSISNIYKAINAESNRINYVITNHIFNITNKLNDHDNLLTNLLESFDFVSNNVNSNYWLITNLQYEVASNYSFTTNELTNIIKNVGITVVGAINSDAEYSTNSNISTMKFDKDSGFTVVTNDMGEKAVQISLGSAWTTLIPDFETLIPGTTNYYPNLKPSGEEKLAIKVVVTNETGTFWDYSNTNKNEKTFYIGIGEDIAGNVPYDKVYTTEEIVVTNVPYPIGQYTNGSIIQAGTTLENVFRKMFTKGRLPVKPTLGITTSGIQRNGTVEYGTNIQNAIITANFVQHDAGPVVAYAFFTNNYLVVSNESQNVFHVDSFRPITTIPFKTFVYYSEGPHLPDMEGFISSDVLSDTFNLYPSRFAFYEIRQTDKKVESRDAVVSLNGKFFARNRNLTISLTAGTKYIIVAIPGNYNLTKMNLRNSFVNESVMNSPNFSSNLVENVYCLNGYTGDEDGGKTYKVYTYFSPSPILENNTDFIDITF